MQQLKLDGSLDGAPVPYLLPAQQAEPALLSANAQGSEVVFLYQTSYPISASQFEIDVDPERSPHFSREVWRVNDRS